MQKNHSSWTALRSLLLRLHRFYGMPLFSCQYLQSLRVLPPQSFSPLGVPSLSNSSECNLIFLPFSGWMIATEEERGRGEHKENKHQVTCVHFQIEWKTAACLIRSWFTMMTQFAIEEEKKKMQQLQSDHQCFINLFSLISIIAIHFNGHLCRLLFLILWSVIWLLWRICRLLSLERIFPLSLSEDNERGFSN